MARLNWRNNSIKLLSALLAFVLWVYVSNEQNPVREKILNVNLEHTGLSQSFMFTGAPPESVRVRVQGNPNQLANLAPGDFRAVVNIPEGKTGDLALPVNVSAPAGLRVTQVSPEEVRVSVDRLVERQVAVAASLRGTPAQGYTALAPVFQPGTVTVRGPARVVNEISQATAVVDIQSVNKNVEQTLPVNVGASTSNVSLNPSTVQVVVPIVNAVSSKIVPVLPHVTGNPAAGFTVKRSFSEPASVQVFGPADVLNAISNIATEPVDIQGIDKNLSKDVGLVSPQGVTGVQPGKVNVQVEVNKVEAPSQPPPNPGDSTKQKP